MANRHLVISVLSIAFTIGVLVYFSHSIFGSSSSYQPDTDFNQVGTLVYNNPGMKPDTWFLVYEQPGQPALYKELHFDSASACAINAPAAPCNPAAITSGVHVRVEGRTVNETVLVRTIQLPEIFVSETSTPTASSTGTTSTRTPASSTTTGKTSGGTATGTASSTPPPTSSSTPTNGITVKLYYYNPSLDRGTGSISCSQAGLVPVTRVIPQTNTPLQDTLKLLLRGGLTSDEQAKGIITEFPLSQVTLLSTSIDNGTLTLTFRDPKNMTSGGSCRVSIMWLQIEATAKQFPGIKEVKHIPDTLFQP